MRLRTVNTHTAGRCCGLRLAMVILLEPSSRPPRRPSRAPASAGRSLPNLARCIPVPVARPPSGIARPPSGSRPTTTPGERESIPRPPTAADSRPSQCRRQPAWRAVRGLTASHARRPRRPRRCCCPSPQVGAGELGRRAESQFNVSRRVETGRAGRRSLSRAGLRVPGTLVVT